MRVDRWAAKPGSPAIVRSNIETGSVILAGPKVEIALIWRAEDKERRRAVPADAYRLRTTRIERTERGSHWFLSSSGPAGKPRRYRAGRSVRLEVDPTVHFRGTVKRKAKQLQLGFTLKGADGRGISIYKDDRRVPVTYRILSADGRALVAGKMRYG